MIRSEQGQSVIEFALILPILLLLICGIFDFSRVLYTYMNLHIITQESVRLGALGDDDLSISQFAIEKLHIGDSNLLEIEIAPTESDRKSGDYMTVTLKYPVTYVTPFISLIFPSPYNVITDSTIRIE
ncbi:pilus assembly protein [Lutibacter sp. B2]|nr:pilus assembly protein [Lutibacter sp. B2]